MNDEITRRLVELTRDLIIIPSTVNHPRDIDRGIEFVRNHLEETPNLNIQSFKPNGVPSLLATPKGINHPQILLAAHLDIVNLPEETIFTSKIENGQIHGTGSADMKGPLAILLEIFRKTHAENPDASLGIVVTTDEERGGEHGIKYLVEEEGMRCGLAIIPDSGSINSVTVEEKGILHIKITSRGEAGHASRPWLADNALQRLMDNLSRVRAFFDGMQKNARNWHPTISVNIVHTENDAFNRIPEEAIAQCDIRFTKPWTAARLLERIKDELDENTEAESIISAESCHFAPDPHFLKVTQEVTGKKVELHHAHGGSDARFLSAHGIPVLMSRPICGNVHSIDEWIDIESMTQLYHIYDRYLQHKFNTSSGN